MLRRWKSQNSEPPVATLSKAAAAQSGQQAGDLHQAGVVQSSDELCGGLLHAANLVSQHGAGDFRILHGKRAAKTAALVCTFHRSVVESFHALQ